MPVSMHPSTADGTTQVNAIFIATSILSIAGSLAILYSYASRRNLRTPSLQMVAVMAICDLGFAAKFLGAGIFAFVGDMGQTWTGTALCHVSGHAGQFFALSSVLWNGVISLNLYFLLSRPRIYKPKKWTRYYHLFVWGFCLFSAVLLAAKDQIGFTEDGTCWISGKRSPYRLLFYLPLFFSFVVAIFAVGYATHRMDACNPTRRTTRKRGSLVRVYLVTIVFVLVWVWSIIFRSVAFASETPPPLWLVYVQAFFLGSQGFFNAIAWGVSLLFTSAARAHTRRRAFKKAYGSDRKQPLHKDPRRPSLVLAVGGAPPLNSDSETPVPVMSLVDPSSKSAHTLQNDQPTYPYDPVPYLAANNPYSGTRRIPTTKQVEHDEVCVSRQSSSDSITDSTTATDYTHYHQPADEAWRIAVRAAAGTPAPSYAPPSPPTPSPPRLSRNDSTAPLDTTTAPPNGHAWERSFYDFYELMAFDPDGQESVSDASLEDAISPAPPSSSSSPHAWKYRSGWSGRLTKDPSSPT
ncbi:slime mold cyclic AMP receptor-domain-containing protein [Phlyctochytrium arcticum]|nr:slime mold cyclic AMP receptor-domain-containing protein [Phlyctochytrium arcticum]